MTNNQPINILVAEDDPASQRILAALLAKAGYQPLTVSNGKEAFELLRQKKAALAVLDWIMPEMDGVEVCRQIREIPSDTPPYLILLTSRSDKSDLLQGLRSGANDYICKPYDPAELEARLTIGQRVVELQAALAGRIEELQKALAQIKALRGLLPICVYCKKIRNDQQYWQQLEDYISMHSEAEFTHGICPDCYQKHVARI